MLDRRAFLAGAALLSTTTSRALAAADEVPIVDSHQHLWDRSRFTLAWLKGGGPELDHDYGLADYARAIEGLPIQKAVYLEVDIVPEQQRDEAKWLVELVRSKAGPTVAGVVSGRPERDDFPDYLQSLKGSPEIKGLRRVLHSSETPKGHALRPEFVKGVRALGAVGLHFEICPRGRELADMVQLVDACPETTFVLDHLGNPDLADLAEWKRQIDAMAKRDRVWCKVSGIVASVKPGGWSASDLAPAVNHVLGAFGPDRVMYGSDWPVCTLRASLREWTEALQAIVAERPLAERRRLFAENATRCYRLA